MGDWSSIPRLGKSPGKRKGCLLQYSCLDNFIDKGAWWATVHGVTKSQTQLSDFHFTSCALVCVCIYNLGFKNTITEMKNILKGINGRICEAEE